MTTQTRNGLIVVAAVAVIGFFAYKKFMSGSVFYARRIKSLGFFSGNVFDLATFDEKFLRAWFKSARKNEPTFSYEGKTYNTQGGKVKQ